MKFIERLKETIKQDLSIEQHEQNPVMRLNNYVAQAATELQASQTFLERHILLKNQIETQYAETEKMLEKRRAQLVLAERADDTLKQFAEDEVALYTTRLKVLADTLQEATETYIHLEQKQEEMRHRLEDMKIRQLQLMAFENEVRANAKMDEIIAAEKTDHAFSKEALQTYIVQQKQTPQLHAEPTSLEARLDALSDTPTVAKEA